MTNRFQWLGVTLAVMVGVATLLVSQAAHSTKPATTKKGGLVLGFPDTCHLPAPPPPAGPGGIPVPYANATKISDSEKKKIKTATAKKQQDTSKPAPADIKRLNLWLDFVEFTATERKRALKTAKAPKSQIIAAHKALAQVLALVAEGRAATKTSKTTAEMYKKFAAVQGKMREIDFPTILRKPITVKVFNKK